MSEIIDLSHKSFIAHGFADNNDDLVAESYSTLGWLVKQLHVTLSLCRLYYKLTIFVQSIRAVPSDLAPVTGTLTEKLREMIDAVKEHDIISGFCEGRNQLEHLDSSFWIGCPSRLHPFYTQISFLFGEGVLSAECHSSIISYFLFLFIWSSFDSKDVTFELEMSTERFHRILERYQGEYDGVRWEFHFSHAGDNGDIHDHLLSIYRNFKDDVKAKSSKPLPISLIRGGLAWFRVRSLLND